MALFSNLVSSFFLTILLLSLQIHGRDSQFFSKVTHPINNNNNDKETDLPNKKEEPAVMNKPDQQEPVFIPETDDNYGLYGHHESAGHFPPSTSTTTTTYQPYKTGESNEEYTTKYPNKYSYYNRNQNDFINNNNNNNYYKDAYGNDLDKTRYAEGGYENVSNQMRKKTQKLYYSNNGGYDRYNQYNGDQRQGMSDTRFKEGGKYNYENNYSREGYQNQLGFEGNNNIDNFQP